MHMVLRTHPILEQVFLVCMICVQDKETQYTAGTSVARNPHLGPFRSSSEQSFYCHKKKERL